MSRSSSKTLAAVLALALCLAFLGCASVPDRWSDSRELIAAGRVEEGLALLKRAADENRSDADARIEYVRQRDLAVGRFLAQADTARTEGAVAQADALYRRVLGIDPANARATTGLELLRRASAHAALLAKAETALKANELDTAAAALRAILTEDPNHRAARALERQVAEKRVRDSLAPPALSAALVNKTLSLEFRDVALRQVLEVITRAAGINFVLDKDIRTDAKATIFVRNTRVGEAIDMLLVTNQLAKKVLNDSTLLVYPNTPQKQKDYQDLVVRSFYLANADPKQTLNLIRTIIKTRDLFVDEKLGLLVMRDTPEAVRLAERLIAAQDLAESEVLLAVEVLEVGRNKLLNLGLRWPNQIAYSLTGAPAAGATTGTGGSFTLTEWLNRSSDMVRITVTDPFFTLNLQQQDGDTNVLANPRIRVKNRDKAKIHIGDRVPVITSTGSTGGFVSQSVSYLDVGLKLEVEPLIYLDDEVGIKVALEVSNIVREVTTTSSTGGTLTYQIGTRNASTVLRLKDGETQVLAGLISDADRRTADRVPWLGDFPVLGKLFTSQKTESARSEIVLLITPRIVRQVARPEARTAEFYSGTETSLGSSAGAPAAAPPPPAAVVPVAPAPLPPGAPGGPAGGAPQPPPSGPGSGPGPFIQLPGQP